MKYKAIIFDLDGTLVDSMWIWKQIDIDFLSARGIELPPMLQHDIEGMSFSETAVYFKERFGLTETLEEIKEEWRRESVCHYFTNAPLKPGALELLEQASKVGMKLGIATSNSKELAEGLLSHLGVRDYFHTIRTSCEVAASKPSPDVYLLAAEDLGILPEDCVAFEDTLAGTTAAYRANMTVYGIKDPTSLDKLSEIALFTEKILTDFHEAIPLVLSE